MLLREEQYQINPQYLRSPLQPSITWDMRVMLVDWMMEVCDEFGLKRETFHLAVQYTDLFLTREHCEVSRL